MAEMRSDCSSDHKGRTRITLSDMQGTVRRICRCRFDTWGAYALTASRWSFQRT